MMSGFLDLIMITFVPNGRDFAQNLCPQKRTRPLQLSSFSDELFRSHTFVGYALF
jgi:hypothetical protein